MKFISQINEKELEVKAIQNNEHISFKFPDGKHEVVFKINDAGAISLLMDGKFYKVNLKNDNGDYQVSVNGKSFDVRIEEKWKAKFAKDMGSKKKGYSIFIKSPMPGKIVRINVQEGDIVKKDQGVIVVEAMKMENELGSPVNGVVEKVNVEVGAIAAGQDVLVSIKPQ